MRRSFDLLRALCRQHCADDKDGCRKDDSASEANVGGSVVRVASCCLLEPMKPDAKRGIYQTMVSTTPSTGFEPRLRLRRTGSRNDDFAAAEQARIERMRAGAEQGERGGVDDQDQRREMVDEDGRAGRRPGRDDEPRRQAGDGARRRRQKSREERQSADDREQLLRATSARWVRSSAPDRRRPASMRRPPRRCAAAADRCQASSRGTSRNNAAPGRGYRPAVPRESLTVGIRAYHYLVITG